MNKKLKAVKPVVKPVKMAKAPKMSAEDAYNAETLRRFQSRHSAAVAGPTAADQAAQREAERRRRQRQANQPLADAGKKSLKGRRGTIDRLIGG